MYNYGSYVGTTSIHVIPGAKVNILGGHSIGHSKQETVYVRYVLFRTVSEIELFHCTVPKLLFLISVFIFQVTKLVQFT
jgi:hypothetical protein